MICTLLDNYVKSFSNLFSTYSLTSNQESLLCYNLPKMWYWQHLKFCHTSDCEMIFTVDFNLQFSELLLTMSIFSCLCAICISPPMKCFFKGVFLIDSQEWSIISPLICWATLNHISFQIHGSACIYLTILLIVFMTIFGPCASRYLLEWAYHILFLKWHYFYYIETINQFENKWHLQNDEFFYSIKQYVIFIH